LGTRPFGVLPPLIIGEREIDMFVNVRPAVSV
jgi:hypothetical protein